MNRPKWQRARVLQSTGIEPWWGLELWVRGAPFETVWDDGPHLVYRSHLFFPDTGSFFPGAARLELLARSPEDFADSVTREPVPTHILAALHARLRAKGAPYEPWGRIYEREAAAAGKGTALQ